MKGHGLLAHLIALQPHRLPLVWLGQRAHRRVPEAVDDPLPRWWRPAEFARRIHLSGQIDDLVLRDDAFRRHGQHCDVAPVGRAGGNGRPLQGAGLFIHHWMDDLALWIQIGARQDTVERDSALHRRLRMVNLLHRQLRCDPWPAGARVARAVVDTHIDAQPLPLRSRVAHHFPPRVGEGDQPVRRAVLDVRRPGRANIRHAKDRGSADAGALELLQVAGDALLGDIAAHPMPPHARLGRLRRILENRLRIGPGGMEGG